MELARTFGRRISSLIILRQVLESIKYEYDYIIIDCTPNMYLVTQNAIAASNGIVIVLLPEYLSRVGIALILRIIDNVNRRLHEHARMFGGTFKGPEIKGIIFNRVRYGSSGILRDQKININEVKMNYKHLVFETFVRESIRIAKDQKEESLYLYLDLEKIYNMKRR
ncbi:MAG: AAA family ATPase [Nitrososphaeria archaeon]